LANGVSTGQSTHGQHGFRPRAFQLTTVKKMNALHGCMYMRLRDRSFQCRWT
jgi:hypothetical protein